MFDYRDIVDYVLIAFHRKPIDSTVTFPHSLDQLHDLARTGCFTSVRLASDISGRNHFYSVTPNASLVEAIDVLSNSGFHRVNVLNEKGRVCGLLSQTDAVQFVAHHCDLLMPTIACTLSELGLLGRPVITVATDSLVVDALRLMSENAVSSVPVVDAEGAIVGNISMTDIKFVFQRQQFVDLWSTCLHMITTILCQTGIENEGRDRVPVFSVHSDSTLLSVVEKIVATRVHRVWIVDEASRAPIGVVSIGDILRILLAAYKRQARRREVTIEGGLFSDAVAQ